MTNTIHPDRLFNFFSTSSPKCYLDEGNHSHDEYEINVIISGTCRYRLGNNEIELRPGMSLMIGRDFPHYISSYDNVVLMGAHICPEMMRNIIEEPINYQAVKWGMKNDYFMRISEQKATSSLVNLTKDTEPAGYRICIDQNITATAAHLLEIFANDTFYSSQVFTSILYNAAQLLSLIIIHSLYEAPLRESQSAIERIRPLKEYLNTHFTMNLHVEDLAENACLSVSYFSELFQQEFHVSPKQYIIQKRLDFACQLLEQKDMSIAFIANQCGFHDISHFYVSFKRKYGMSPAVYRRNHAGAI